MAMITCPECGKEISSLASSCPNCGAPIKELKKVNLHFYREKKFGGSAYTGPVSVDGAQVGVGSSGCDFYVKVSPGTHVISISIAHTNNDMIMNEGTGDTKTIDVPESAKSVEIEIRVKSGLFVSHLVFGAITIL